MARPLRIQLPGLTYHVHSRGNGKMAIYLDDRDRTQFLAMLGDVATSCHVTCHTYCLMDNHYHLVITTRDANLSKSMQKLNGRYAQWWNRRHARVGHPFQGRFGAKIVQEDVYLLTVCRYVVLNPVRKGLVESPEQWPWSSYRSMAGLEPLPSFVTPDLVWHLMGGDDYSTRVRRYRHFVAQIGPDAQKVMRLPIIGQPEFVARFDKHRRKADQEVCRQDRDLRPSLESLFQNAMTRASRNVQLVNAHAAGYSLADIARFLDLHPSTVSKMVRPAAGSDVKKPCSSDLTPTT